ATRSAAAATSRRIATTASPSSRRSAERTDAWSHTTRRAGPTLPPEEPAIGEPPAGVGGLDSPSKGDEAMTDDNALERRLDRLGIRRDDDCVDRYLLCN